jgi:hypothetical protein
MVADTREKGFYLSVAAKLFQEAGQPAEAEAMQSAYRALSLAPEMEAQIAQRATSWSAERPRVLDDELEAELLAVLLPGARFELGVVRVRRPDQPLHRCVRNGRHMRYLKFSSPRATKSAQVQILPPRPP